MTRAFFVTGTDTEVGKTAVSCALLAAARSVGLTTAAVKPVAAGCDDEGRNDDALLLQQHATLPLGYEQVNPVALEAAVAPHIAAAREGRKVAVADLVAPCRQVLDAGADLALVEGAGGWRVPLGPGETLADLAIALDLEVILVVSMRLGCINHALLTAEAVRRDGLVLAGWVANTPGERMDCYDENLDTLAERLPAPCLGAIPQIVPFTAEMAKKLISIQSLIP